MEKRKAATDIFMQQQAMPEEELDMGMEDDFGGAEEAMAPEGEYIQQDISNTLGQNEIDGLLMAASSKGGGGIAPAMSQSRGFGGPPPSPFPASKPKKKKRNIQFSQLKTSEELQLEKEPIQVRETGILFWRRIIVPPNAYVVHTRFNKKEPVTLGLGTSFRYNPYTDSYLIIPAAMQTIGVVANCITKEKQGINILAYVQWQIDDFSLAYKKLDFSDRRDPLGIVNAQLREQAEAAIKDKIATMSVEEVLTDKAPVIEELTSRLTRVTEGARHDDAKGTHGGLGIKIVTVQIREAIVSSETLWTDLQSPFRYEQQKKSRISYLEMQKEVSKKEAETRKLTETNEVETQVEITRIKEKKQTEAQELKLTEEAIRYEREQQHKMKKLQLNEKEDLARKESEERRITKENEFKAKRELEIVRQENDKKMEMSRLSLESKKEQQTLETEEKVHALHEEHRFDEITLDFKQKLAVIENVFKQKELEFQQDIMQKQAELDRISQEALLILQKKEHEVSLELKRQDEILQFEKEKNQAAIEKMRQEVRNLMSNNALFNEFVKQLPAIAENMPEISEMKVFQSSEKGDSFDGLTFFLAKLFSTAESIGISLPGKKENEE